MASNIRNISFPFLAICAFLLTSPTLLLADYFPFATGNTWNFNFTQVSGGMVGSIHQKGTVQWVIESVEVLESTPLQYRININEVRSLKQRIDTLYILDTAGVFQATDTTYNPAIKTETQKTLRATEGENGLQFSTDTCWSFVREKSGGNTQSMVSLSDTSLTFTSSGPSLPAIKVDPTPCLNPSPDGNIISGVFNPYYYLQADNIGPVGYHIGNTSLILDAFFQEDWHLTTFSLEDTSGTSIDLDKQASLPLQFHPESQNLSFEMPKGGFTTFSFSDYSGRTQPIMPLTYFPPGKHIIHLNKLPSQKSGVIRIRGKELNETVKVFP